MRKTLEDFYYGNITSSTQDMTLHPELKRSTDRVACFENQLAEQLNEVRQAILVKLIESQQEIDRITALENFILGFRLGVRMMAECMDDNDGDIKMEVNDSDKKRANGEGSLRKRPDGCWEGRYTAGRDPVADKAIYKNVPAKMQKACTEKLVLAIEKSGKIDVAKAG